MSESSEEEQSGSRQEQIEEDPADIYKVRPPSKKKYEEEMEKLLSQIKEKEAEIERLKSLGRHTVTNELQRIKAEKSATIAKRKKIDQELEKLKKIIPDKMRQLVQLESSLIYKSEERINTAVQRLEWNLKVQPFKLMEEKKIVSEIDRLKRSKKTLVQYMALKQDISGIRDMQRRLREERDTYFQAVGKLNAEEERLRRDSMTAKTTLSVLKLQLDELHESKRQLVASHKKQMEEFQGAKEKQRKGSWKKREDYKKSVFTERRQQLVDVEMDKTAHDRYISWCNSLIKVLSRYNRLSSQEPSPESLSPASSVEEPELAEEIDDGQYVLLKKPDDSLENAAGTRRPSKKNRRPRKQSSLKKVTLSPDMVQQLTELGLKAPNSLFEVSQAIESLRLKKILLEQEQQASEVASDAGISATESLICEMSRQVSKTESFEGTVDTNPGDQVYEEILCGCSDEQGDQPEGWEVAGAVGGCEELEILSPNSDSTVEGDTGSIESQSSVCDVSESTECCATRSTEASESEHRQDKVKISYLPLETSEELVSAKEEENPSLYTPLCPVTGHRVEPSTSSSEFPALAVKHGTPPDFSTLTGNRSVWKLPVDQLRPVHHIGNVLPASSPVQPHGTSAATSSTSSEQSHNLALPPPQSLSELMLDNRDFPLLSESLNRPRRGSNISTRSSDGSSAQTEQLPIPCGFQPGTHSPNQITGCISPVQTCNNPAQTCIDPAQACINPSQAGTKTVCQVPQSQMVPVSASMLVTPLTSRKSPEALPLSNRLLSRSRIPSLDLSSTEKWVESSVAYIKDLIQDPCMDHVPATVTESTRL